MSLDSLLPVPPAEGTARSTGLLPSALHRTEVQLPQSSGFLRVPRRESTKPFPASRICCRHWLISRRCHDARLDSAVRIPAGATGLKTGMTAQPPAVGRAAPLPSARLHGRSRTCPDFCGHGLAGGLLPPRCREPLRGSFGSEAGPTARAQGHYADGFPDEQTVSPMAQTRRKWGLAPAPSSRPSVLWDTGQPVIPPDLARPFDMPPTALELASVTRRLVLAGGVGGLRRPATSAALSLCVPGWDRDGGRGNQ